MRKQNLSKSKKHILITSIAFLPNIGGVETHLKDLVNVLVQKKWQITVLTYQPLQTPTQGEWIERKDRVTIIRLPVVKGLFYKLVDKPLLEFLFLAPLQFIVLPIVLAAKPVKVINAQGLVAGFSCAFWSLIFGNKYVIALQNIYHFPQNSLYRKVAQLIIDRADLILSQSRRSSEEIASLGIKRSKIVEFRHWEDTNEFKPIPKSISQKMIGFKSEFIVSFFGRLVEIKGINEFLDSIKFADPRITFLVYGEGPLKKKVESVAKSHANLKYMGIVSPDELPVHYSAADLIVMPSTHEEGFGRVAVEALLCGTPVIVANRGSLPDIVNEKVGRVIEVNSKNIAKEINFFFKHPNDLKKRAGQARNYAKRKFSDKNAEVIIKAFT